MSGSVNIPAAIGGGVTAGLVLVGVILLLLWRIFYYQVQSSESLQQADHLNHLIFPPGPDPEPDPG